MRVGCAAVAARAGRRDDGERACVRVCARAFSLRRAGPGPRPSASGQPRTPGGGDGGRFVRARSPCCRARSWMRLPVCGRRLCPPARARTYEGAGNRAARPRARSCGALLAPAPPAFTPLLMSRALSLALARRPLTARAAWRACSYRLMFGWLLETPSIRALCALASLVAAVLRAVPRAGCCM